MTPLQAIRECLAEIERELRRELSVPLLARRAGMSLWHFQRTFAAMVGEPVGGYIRRRRLTEAAKQLGEGGVSILDLALEFQFESHAAFTRAFKSEFAVLPSEVKRGRNVSDVWCEPVLLSAESVQRRFQSMNMKPEFVTLPARQFVGLQAKFISARSPEANNMQVIPRLWGAFFERVAELASEEPGAYYGLCDCVDATGLAEAGPDELLYLAAVPAKQVPAGMAAWQSPAGEYARFLHRGPVSGIGATMNYIYGSWFPSSGMDHGPGPDLERYDDRFGDGQGANCELEIFVPVKRKKNQRTARS